jgi:hypothetical protein
MITTKNIKSQKMTPEERKTRVSELRAEHVDYFDNLRHDFQYIPKMAYRPSGKDELHISFFPSELQKGKDVYTEFVSIDYESEDPKRTLYLWEYNPHWEEEYELIESSSGFQRHIIPVGELKVINDINSRNPEVEKILDITDPTEDTNDIVSALNRISENLENITYYLKKMGT